jgi:hypothetical protein
MSRTKGSKNKTKFGLNPRDTIETEKTLVNEQELGVVLPIIKRGRGRPRKVKLTDDELEIKKDNTLLVNLFVNEKEIKAEIRRLKKLKLQCRPGSAERLDLGHKIKDLKKQKVKITEVEPGKEKLIAEIKKLDHLFEVLEINLNKFTIAQLEYHLNKKKGLYPGKSQVENLEPGQA